jgi:hypothetical protein
VPSKSSALELVPGHPRQAEEVLDQLSHPLTGLADTQELGDALRAQVRHVLVDERLGKTVDVAQRRPEITTE